MDPWISAIVAATTWILGNAANHEAKKKTAKENAISARNEATEYQRQKTQAQSDFNTDITTRYGSDFLSKLNSSASVSDLIGTIGKDTALGKQLAEYETLAQQVVSNATTSNQQTGLLANMQGQSDALSIHQQNIQATMSEGAASASQATSGIRTTGTGDNLRRMQELQNDITSRLATLGMNQSTIQTIFGMQNTQTSAVQQAEAQRRQSMITEQQAIEQALSAYTSNKSYIADLDASISSAQKDAEYWDDEYDDLNSFWGNVGGVFGF
jgi:hypothetical protein